MIKKITVLLICIQFSISQINSQTFKACEKKQLVGICDENGKIIIPQMYQSAFPCYNYPGLYLVELKNKYGIVDKDNKPVLSLDYEFDMKFSNPFIIDGEIAYFDSTSIIILQKKGKYGLIDSELKPIIPFTYEYLSYFHYFLSPTFIAEKDKKFSLIDMKQKLITKSEFIDYAGFFIIDSYDLVYALFKNKNQKWIFVDIDGNEYPEALARTQYGNDTLVKKYCPVRYMQKYAAFDYTGNLIAQGYDEMSQFVKLYPENSFEYAVFSVKNKYGILRSDGQEILKPVYDNIDPLYITGQVIKTSLNGKEGIVDLRTGKEIVAPIYDEIWIFDWLKEVTYVKNNGKCALINNKGTLLCDFIYDEIQTYQDSLYGARKGDKWGYINLKGQIIIPFEFDNTEGFFNEDIIPLLKNSKFGYISKTGKHISEFKYDKAEHFYSNPKARIVFNGKKGWINKNGNESWD